uniref:CESA6 n=1 Tax=Arundo donax TaxID=35708 RepID=A0A0A9EJL7_ARUDO
MIAHIVSRPGASILHCPSFLGNLFGFRNQGIDSYLEFLVFSLHCSPLPNKGRSNLIF